MKEKMWDVMDEYIYVAGTVEIFERDVIDEAASRVRLKAFTTPPDLKELEDKVESLCFWSSPGGEDQRQSYCLNVKTPFDL